MKKLISVILAVLFLAALAVPAFSEGEIPQATDYTTGTPWLDIDLEGVVTEEMEALAKDNFALYANKEKLLTMEIPEGYPSGGTLMDVYLLQADAVRDMFLGTEPETHDAKQAYFFYQLLMDWETRNSLGVAPLKERMGAVEAISSIDELTDYFLEVPVEEQLDKLWSGEPTTNPDDSDQYILCIDECSLLLADSAEYGGLTDSGAIKKDAYTVLAQKILVKLGYSEEESLKKIDNCFAFESLIAPAVYTNEEKGRGDYLSRINNHYTLDEVKEVQGSLPILEVLAKIGYPEAEDYLVVHPEFLTRMNELYSEENLPLIKDYFIVNGVVSAASILDRECYEWHYACQNAIYGTTGMLEDETVFSTKVANTLEWPVAQLYTEKYLNKEDKDRISEMVEDVRDAYHGILSEADFLSEETREKAIEKLDAIEPRILYPDSWEKYDCAGLEITPQEEGGTLWQAVNAISRFNLEKSVKDYSEPVDKEKWGMTPQTVNCFYNPVKNCIMILGAFAQGDIYNSRMSDEELLAKLGNVIGHEFSHAFDRSGAQFDKDGNMINWWAEEDYAVFLDRNAKMEAYYDAMHPWEGQNFYGSIMTGEACADMAGMKCMLRIAAEKEDFDYDAFFRAFADLWLEKDTLQMAYSLINDTHPMGYLRINCTLQQFDEFLDFYGITEGDGMYLAPEDRVSIW